MKPIPLDGAPENTEAIREVLNRIAGKRPVPLPGRPLDPNKWGKAMVDEAIAKAEKPPTKSP